MRVDGTTPRTAPPPVSRRLFLADVGRVTLGAIVLGPALTGCTDDGAGDDGSATAAPTGGGTPSPEPTTSRQPTGARVEWQRASLGFVSAYVLVRRGEGLLFDTGTGDDAVGPIAAALEAIGVGWDAIGHVVLSHRHGDHIGGLGAVLREAPGATVYGALPDLDEVREQVDGAVPVVDGDTVMGLRVVATPGHTEGHIAAFDEGQGLLLAGDALVNGVAIGGASGDGLEPSPPEFTADAGAAAASVGVLAALRPATILFGHGEPLGTGAAEALDELAVSL